MTHCEPGSRAQAFSEPRKTGATAETCSGTTLMYRWNGSAWSPQSIAIPTGATSTQLYGLTCTGSTLCTAVGHWSERRCNNGQPTCNCFKYPYCTFKQGTLVERGRAAPGRSNPPRASGDLVRRVLHDQRLHRCGNQRRQRHLGGARERRQLDDPDHAPPPGAGASKAWPARQRARASRLDRATGPPWPRPGTGPAGRSSPRRTHPAPQAPRSPGCPARAPPPAPESAATRTRLARR